MSRTSCYIGDACRDAGSLVQRFALPSRGDGVWSPGQCGAGAPLVACFPCNLLTSHSMTGMTRSKAFAMHLLHQAVLSVQDATDNMGIADLRVYCFLEHEQLLI